MIVFGFDPGTKTAGFGVLNDGRPVHAHLFKAEKLRAKLDVRRLDIIQQVSDYLSDYRVEAPEAMDVERIIIESQTYRTGSPVRAQDLIHVGHLTGAMAGICRLLWPHVEIVIVRPEDWKASVPKAVMTKRILKDLGLAYDPRGGLSYVDGTVRVPGSTTANKKDAGDVIDALGLAKWGYRTRVRSGS
jgi:hypothetical protein